MGKLLPDYPYELPRIEFTTFFDDTEYDVAKEYSKIPMETRQVLRDAIAELMTNPKTL